MFPLLKRRAAKSSYSFWHWWIRILFFGLPLVFFSGNSQGFEIAKFIFWEIWWLVYVIWLVSGRGWRKLWQIGSISAVFGWIFILILGISAIQGGQISFLGSIFRKQGWIFFFQLWIFYLGVKGKKKELYSISMQGLALSTVILVTMGVWERLIGWARVGASFGEPNANGGYLAFVFPLLLIKRWWFGAILAIFGIYLTESRSAMLALGVSAVVLFLGKIKSLKFDKVYFIFLSLIVISAVFFAWKWKDLRISYQDNRWGIWKMSLSAISARPATGYGVDNIEGVLNDFAVGRQLTMKGIVVDRAHSLFLDLWLWSGILGLISFAGFVSGIFWQYFKRKNRDWNLIASIFGFLVFSGFNPVTIPMWVLFYFVLAMMGVEDT